MPTLDWIGKKAVLNHHRQVPLHLLRVNEAQSVQPTDGNLVLQGDNLLALKALLPQYSGQVKCVYIDPPYNTGAEHWVFDDAVKGPEVSDWLGRVVGQEAEDLSRHDKWLCMMYPRLALLREFLRPDGVLFVSMDDNELASLRSLLDELLGPRNYLGTLVWKRRSSSAMRGTPLSVDHEYVVAYGRDSSRTTLHGLVKEAEDYPFQDGRGRYASTDLTVGMGRDERPGQYFTITNPRTGVSYAANPNRVWRFFPETMARVIADDLVIWPDESPGNMERPRYKTYFDPDTEKPKPISTWVEKASANDRGLVYSEGEFDITILQAGMTQEGGKLLAQLLGTRAFSYPKPLSLVRSLVRAATKGSDLVLDSFAGSGTTGHAVLSLNSEDRGSRKFILVERQPEIASGVTAERLRRVISGYSFQNAKGKTTRVAGTGSGFAYVEVGDRVLDPAGAVAANVTRIDLARIAYFAATSEPLREVRPSALLGVHNGTAVYLVPGAQQAGPEAVGELTSESLGSLPPFSGPKVVFGTGCRLSAERLGREDVSFRQIPYQLDGL